MTKTSEGNFFIQSKNVKDTFLSFDVKSGYSIHIVDSGYPKMIMSLSQWNNFMNEYIDNKKIELKARLLEEFGVEISDD